MYEGKRKDKKMEDQKPETAGPPWFRRRLLLVSFFLFSARALASALGLRAALALVGTVVLALRGSAAAFAFAGVLAFTTVFFGFRLGSLLAAVSSLVAASLLRSANSAGTGNKP